MKKSNPFAEELPVLTKEIKQMEQELDTYSNGFSEANWKKEATEMFERFWSHSLSLLKSSNRSPKPAIYNYDSLSHKRRLKATLDAIPSVQKQFREKYSAIPVDKEFISFNTTMTLQSYDSIDDDQHLSLAASMWIADELAFHPGFHKVYPYLPKPEEYVDSFFPNIIDTAHPRGVLQAIYYVVTHRNDAAQEDHSYFSLAGEASVRRALNEKEKIQYSLPDPTENLSCRDRFDALISLIHPIKIERACKRFEQNATAFLDLYFDCCSKATEKLNGEQRKLLLHLKEREKELKQQQVATHMSFAPFSAGKRQIGDVLSLSAHEMQMYSPDTIDKIADMYERVNDNIGALNMIKVYAIDAVSSDDYYRKKRSKYGTDSYTQEKFENFTVEDPYETAFALLYLIDSGSDLPWIYTQGLGVANAAANLLPWARRRIKKRDWEAEAEDYEFDDDMMDLDCRLCDEDMDSQSKTDQNQSQKEPVDFSFTPVDWVPEYAKMYERRYTDKCLWQRPKKADPNKVQRMNLPQIVYEMGFGIIPRDIHYEIDIHKDLRHSGFSEKEAKLLELYIALVNTNVKKETNLLSYVSEFPDYIIESDREYADETSETEDDLLPIEDNTDELKSRISLLKNQLKSEHIEKSDLRRRLREQEKTEEILQKEISRLRECLQRFESAEADYEDPDDTISFPYTAKHRIVVFGGSEKWLKIIRKKINNVRFIDPDAIPNTDMIVRADVVFVQSNVIPHRLFNRVAALTRQYDIPMVYFKYAGAEKCARQLAKYDMEIN